MTSFLELDVRPILRAGGEPLGAIMQAIKQLGPDQGLRLFATFKPVPLFSVLGERGFAHEERELGNGEWEVVFRPQGEVVSKETPPAAPIAAGGDTWGEPVVSLDNRELDPPEPMVRILAALEQLKAGDVLSALLCREPIFLFPELKKRGHQWRGGFEPDGATFKVLVRVGTP